MACPQPARFANCRSSDRVRPGRHSVHTAAIQVQYSLCTDAIRLQYGVNPGPEGDLALAQAVIYLATAPKSNAAYVAAGGPQTFSQNEIAELAFAVLGKPPRITHVPLWLSRAIVAFAKRLGMRTSMGPIEFFLEASALDMSATAHGTRTLAEEFSTHRSTRAAPV